MVWLNRAPLLLALMLLPLAACSSTPDDDQGTSTATVAPDGETAPLEGESITFDGQLRLTVPEGWMVQTAEMTGWEAYLATVVPDGTAHDALAPGQPHVDFARLILLNIGRTHGAQGYAAAQMEDDSANTEFYSDIEERDPVMLGEETFYGYEGVLSTSSGIERFQYWYGDAHGDTYKFEIFGERDDDDVPQDLVDVILNAEFIE